MTLFPPALQAIEDDILLAVNGLHSPFFDQFMWFVSDKLIWLPFYLGLFYFIAKSVGWKHAVIALVGIALVVILSDQLAVRTLRIWFPRMRPAFPDNPIAPLVHIVNDYRSGKNGFPSAHAFNVFGLATYVTLLLRYKWLSISLFLWAILICYSRRYLGVHYLGDLLFGAVVGSLFAWGAFALHKHYFKLKRPKKLPTTFWFLGGTIASFVLVLLCSFVYLN